MVRRSKSIYGVIGQVPSPLEGIPSKIWRRAETLAALLRPTMDKPLTLSRATRLARLAKLSVASVYRYRQRFADEQHVTSLLPRPSGFRESDSRLATEQHTVILQVIEQLQQLGHRLRVIDVVAEVQQRCRVLKLEPPSRRAVDRRIERFAPHLVERRAGNIDRPNKKVLGRYHVEQPLAVVQIDHTRSDIFVVDDLYRRVIGRPILSIALDIATRCILGFTVTFEGPSAATVALLLTRVVAAKDRWLASLGLDFPWPMAGLPKSLHLDNAPEFHSHALTRGCAEFGIELIYRPLGRPHFGGHIERFIGTLMSRLKALPGATGSSVAGRKRRKPEKSAVLTLAELESWLAVEIGEVYHHSEHRGLPGATPAGAWKVKAPLSRPLKNLKAFHAAFLPAIERTVSRSGILFNHVHYWHPTLANLAGQHRKIIVHFDPADVSRLYFHLSDKTWIELTYAQVHRPAVSLWEVKAANKHLRATSKALVSEERLFKAILAQRKVVATARAQTKQARKASKQSNDRARSRSVLRDTLDPPRTTTSGLDYSQPAEGYPVEIW